MKKIISAMLAATLCIGMLAGCNGQSKSAILSTSSASKATSSVSSKNVISDTAATEKGSLELGKAAEDAREKECQSFYYNVEESNDGMNFLNVDFYSDYTAKKTAANMVNTMGCICDNIGNGFKYRGITFTLYSPDLQNDFEFEVCGTYKDSTIKLDTPAMGETDKVDTTFVNEYMCAAPYFLSSYMKQIK